MCLPGNTVPGHFHPVPQYGDWRRLGVDVRCLALPESKIQRDQSVDRILFSQINTELQKLFTQRFIE